MYHYTRSPGHFVNEVPTTPDRTIVIGERSDPFPKANVRLVISPRGMHARVAFPMHTAPVVGGEWTLGFTDAISGTFALVSANAIVEALVAHAPSRGGSLSLVFLNACRTDTTRPAAGAAGGMINAWAVLAAGLFSLTICRWRYRKHGMRVSPAAGRTAMILLLLLPFAQLPCVDAKEPGHSKGDGGLQATQQMATILIADACRVCSHVPRACACTG